MSQKWGRAWKVRRCWWERRSSSRQSTSSPDPPRPSDHKCPEIWNEKRNNRTLGHILKNAQHQLTPECFLILIYVYYTLFYHQNNRTITCRRACGDYSHRISPVHRTIPSVCLRSELSRWAWPLFCRAPGQSLCPDPLKHLNRWLFLFFCKL